MVKSSVRWWLCSMALPRPKSLALWVLSSLGLGTLALPVLALSNSIGTGGINARRLHGEPYNITGEKIAVGQVEIGRPSQFGLDKLAYEAMPVVVRRVFFQDRLATADEYVDGHAANVASVIISQDKLRTGVAPGASLFAAAVGPLSDRSGQPDECIASQHVALSNSGDLRAINFSFGEPLSRDPRPNPVLDGNALLTQCIDWSQRVHDVLYVIAGNQGGGGIPIPTDNFNGINVAYSRLKDGVYSKVDFANLSSEPDFRSRRSPAPETNVGARRSINITAPGSQIELIDPDGRIRIASGTSFAAPHVVGAVALIQQLADRQIRAGQPNWNLDARRSIVSKAILLNSADKLADQGNGLRLGMERTLTDESNRTWVDSDAYAERAIPLHKDMGTGHLNAFRAYQQFLPGFAKPETAVPVVGWNYDRLALSATAEAEGASRFHDYVFEAPLQAGSYFSATLAWERFVELNDANDNGLYDIGETFTDRGLNNLDIYLMPAGSDDISDSIWSSESAEDSVEHIFYEIPQTGQYKLRVVYQQQVHDQAAQPYALAWWAVAAAN